MDLWIVLSFVGCFAVGVYLGFKINDWFIRFTFKAMMEEAGLTGSQLDKFTEHFSPILDPESQPRAEGVSIKLEKIGSVIYCYAKDTDEFLGQGSNEDELVEVLTRRLGPVTLHVQPEDGAEHLKISV